MAIIAKSLLTLIAPVLTYTADEIVEHAPKVLKNENEDIFDFEYESIKEIKSDFDEDYMLDARRKFNEIVDGLKKDKLVKSSLELVIETESKKVLDIDETEREDWFIISGVLKDIDSEVLGEFEVEGDLFYIKRAKLHKCPRCWKYKALEENGLCDRCKRVLNGSI